MQRLNLRVQQRTVLNQAYQIRRNIAKIVEAEKAGAQYHLLASIR
jgi:hypothetical protein